MNTQSPANDPYDIKVVMINSDGYYLSLAPDAILDIQIEENLNRWWMRGYIDIKNEHDFIERAAAAGGRLTDIANLDEKTFNKGKTDSAYVFRNDGTDMVYVQFQLPESKGDHFHMFRGFFNVYDVQDLDLTGRQKNKVKRLMLHDERYQRMLYSNIPWSTTSLTESTPAEMRQGAASRSVPTGAAIKHLLKLVLGDDTPFPPAWDNGSTTTMFSSPANFNCIDDLEYIMRNHVSSTDLGSGQGVLFFDRPNNIWRLVNLELLFHQAARYSTEHSKWLAGPLQTEEFDLLSYPDTMDTSKDGESPYVPLGGDRVYQNYNLGYRSTINTVEYHEINSSDNLSNVVTTPVHMYNKAKKRFQIKQGENSIESIYDKMTRIVEHTPRPDVKKPGALSVDINARRKLNNNIKHMYTTVTDSDKKYLNAGINKSIYNSIMLSNAVEFVVPGHPSRGVGRFISIRPENELPNNFSSAYHDKVFGQYLVTSVVHRYAKGLYSNTIVGVKPYNYQPVHNNEESEPETFEQFQQFDVDETPTGMSLGDFFSNDNE